MITIKDLSFSYGNNAVLKQISMELLPGNIYGLLGENGVGKTTLLTLLCGLKKPQVGTIDIDGFKPYDRKPSLLSEIYYLSDEVAEITTVASSEVYCIKALRNCDFDGISRPFVGSSIRI